MAKGDSKDLLARVKQLIPSRWFSTGAPIRDAIMGGISDTAAWVYSLTDYVKTQSRIATATGLWLDLIAFDFLGLYIRRKQLNDKNFRAKIKATILQERVTRKGMISAVKTLTGATATIFEPWSPQDAGAWNKGSIAWSAGAYGSVPGGGWNTTSGWNANASGWSISPAAFIGSAGAGGWGTMLLPAQVFVTVPAAAAQGIPAIGGWSQGPAAWNGGIGEFVSNDILGVGALTNADIYAMVAATKPTGVTAWTQLK